VTKSTIIRVELLPDAACQKLLKSTNVSRSDSKNKSGTFLWTTVYAIIVMRFRPGYVFLVSHETDFTDFRRCSNRFIL